MRVQKNKSITEALRDSESKMKKVEAQCQQKQQLREKLCQMHAKLRTMQVSIENERLNQKRLQSVRDEEENLRNLRDLKEKQTLTLAQEEQK